MNPRKLLPVMAALAFLMNAYPIAAQDAQEKSSSDSRHWYDPTRYNPLKLIKRGPKSANDQLASDGHLEDNLTRQLRLQGILPAEKELQEVCTEFRDLPTCIAVLRLSRSLPVEFSCLKWDVTGMKPRPVADTCAGPAGGKAMPVNRAVDLLKPEVNSRAEAADALKKARDDIRDAHSWLPP
jgi:hypothetical protein